MSSLPPTSPDSQSAHDMHQECSPDLDRPNELKLISPVTQQAQDHQLATAPLITYDAYKKLCGTPFPQTALLGAIITQQGEQGASNFDDPRLYFNTNAPLSAVVCGVQGSGKSHTVSVLLENCMLQDSDIGQLKEPMSGVVFHFDSAAGGTSVNPCEAAYLSRFKDGRPAVPVTVLVSPSNLQTMKRVYHNLPVKVESLRLSPSDITAERLQALMLCDSTERRPLYMEVLLSTMRDMGENFDFKRFRRGLEKGDWMPGQKQGLKQRLSLLDTYLKGGTSENDVKNYFKQGHLVIVDLTDPMVDGVTSSGIFDLILGLFMETPVQDGGRVIVLDEAHKYLRGDQGSERLTLSIESIIRQQRHLGVRTVISTQEPTVIPASILDLVSFAIIHQFMSPAWAQHLEQHMSIGVSKSNQGTSWFNQVLSLGTGQALVYGVSTLCCPRASDDDQSTQVSHLGQGYLKIGVRARVTTDGGQSVMAVALPVSGATDQSVSKGTVPVAKNRYEMNNDAESWVVSSFKDTSQYIGSSWREACRSPDSTTSSPREPSEESSSDVFSDQYQQSLASTHKTLLSVLYQGYKAGKTDMAWSQVGSECKPKLVSTCQSFQPGWLRSLITAAEDDNLVHLTQRSIGAETVSLTSLGVSVAKRRPSTQWC